MRPRAFIAEELQLEQEHQARVSALWRLALLAEGVGAAFGAFFALALGAAAVASIAMGGRP